MMNNTNLRIEYLTRYIDLLTKAQAIGQKFNKELNEAVAKLHEILMDDNVQY